MKIIFDSFLIPGIGAIVGFFWLLAYKHPRTFRAVSAPIVFLAMVGLIGSAGYGLAWSNYSMELGTYEDIWKPLEGIEAAKNIPIAVEDRINQIGRLVIPVVSTSGAVLCLMVFFLWISTLIKMEKDAEKPKDDKKDDDSKT